MKITEIRKQRKAIQDEIEVAKDILEAAKMKFKKLHRQCKHPKMIKGFAYGEHGDYCPDCGYEGRPLR
jgi:hypothetical protein